LAASKEAVIGAGHKPAPFCLQAINPLRAPGEVCITPAKKIWTLRRLLADSDESPTSYSLAQNNCNNRN
jgi:hypothetical protein